MTADWVGSPGRPGQHPIGIIPGEVVWKLHRVEQMPADWTRGVLRTHSTNYDTLEEPWLSNAVDCSCIVPGKYHVVPHESDPLRLRLRNVPGRTGIEIHVGNTLKDTEGCILPGLSYDSRGVLHSREAMEQIMRSARQVWHAGASLYLDVLWTEDAGEVHHGHLVPTTPEKGRAMNPVAHRTTLTELADVAFKGKARTIADAVIDLACGAYKAEQAAKSGDFEGAVKDVEPLISEIDKLIAEAGPGISKAWHDVVEHLRGHHHAKS